MSVEAVPIIAQTYSPTLLDALPHHSMKQLTQFDALFFLLDQERVTPEGAVVFQSEKATGRYFMLPGLDKEPLAEISYETTMFFLAAFKTEGMPPDEAGNDYVRFPFATLHDTSHLEAGMRFMNLLPHLYLPAPEPKQPRQAREPRTKKAT